MWKISVEYKEKGRDDLPSARSVGVRVHKPRNIQESDA